MCLRGVRRRKGGSKTKTSWFVCVPRRPYGYYGDLLLTGVNAYGFITLGNPSSITVNDSLDCSHGPYGHGAKIKMLCSDRDIAKIMRNFR